MKRIVLGILTLAIFLVGPTSTFASTKTSDVAKTRQQLVLLQEINRLLLEVQRLQDLLKERLALLPEQPYQSVFFDRPYEAIYFVDGVSLQPVNQFDSVRPLDKELFNLLKNTVGEAVVREKVKEWRVFYDEAEDLGGFVELIAGTDGWIFGVNRAQYEANDIDSTHSFINLFIHEYAHLLLYSQPEFAQNYADKFWTTTDKRHQVYVGQMSEEKRFSFLTKYFEANQERFVSDYATLSPDEDLAETFGFFVIEGKGDDNTIRSEKINTFYEVPEFVSVRNTLRNNLKKLGVLELTNLRNILHSLNQLSDENL